MEGPRSNPSSSFFFDSLKLRTAPALTSRVAAMMRFENILNSAFAGEKEMVEHFKGLATDESVVCVKRNGCETGTQIRFRIDLPRGALSSSMT